MLSTSLVSHFYSPMTHDPAKSLSIEDLESKPRTRGTSRSFRRLVGSSCSTWHLGYRDLVSQSGEYRDRIGSSAKVNAAGVPLWQGPSLRVHVVGLNDMGRRL